MATQAAQMNANRRRGWSKHVMSIENLFKRMNQLSTRSGVWVGDKFRVFWR
jgi:hypothetical protein